MLYNKGLVHYKNLEDYLLPANSCEFDFNQGERGGIRIRGDSSIFEVEIKNANGDTSYNFCTRTANTEPFTFHLGMVASNEKAVNDIDLMAVFVKNMNPKLYQNKQAMEEYRLK